MISASVADKRISISTPASPTCDLSQISWSSFITCHILGRLCVCRYSSSQSRLARRHLVDQRLQGHWVDRVATLGNEILNLRRQPSDQCNRALFDSRFGLDRRRQSVKRYRHKPPSLSQLRDRIENRYFQNDNSNQQQDDRHGVG